MLCGVVGEIIPWRGDPSQFPQHLVHLVCVNRWIIPTHTVASLAEHPTDLPVHHAANELVPWRLQTLAIGNARLSGVVEELIVADPKGSVPSFVVCPTVHGVVCCVDVDSIRGQRRGRRAPV
jgi:hypothetical protein